MLFLSLDFFQEFSFDKNKHSFNYQLWPTKHMTGTFFFFFFCQKHMTTTRTFFNQQSPTLVWWHCFFLILMLREPYLSMRCPDGGCICLSVSIFFSKVLSTTLFFWSLSPQTMFNIIIQVYLYGSGAVYTC